MTRVQARYDSLTLVTVAIVCVLYTKRDQKIEKVEWGGNKIDPKKKKGKFEISEQRKEKRKKNRNIMKFVKWEERDER